MSLDFELMKLIARGKKPDARYDIVQLIDTYKGVTVAFLDQEITDLQDKAIRNFLDQLEGIHYIEIMTYKSPGGRRVQIISRKGATFDLADVIKRHKATHKKRTVYKDTADTVMIYDIPFQIKYRNDKEYDLINEEYGLCQSFYSQEVEEAQKFMKKILNKMRFQPRTTKLVDYLKMKRNEHLVIYENEKGEMK